MLSGKLDSLLAADHTYWKQRSKITWLKDDDHNTKYFHSKASNRSLSKNRLVRLFDANGVWQTLDQGMDKMILDYFKICLQLLIWISTV